MLIQNLGLRVELTSGFERLRMASCPVLWQNWRKELDARLPVSKFGNRQAREGGLGFCRRVKDRRQNFCCGELELPKAEANRSG